MVERLIVFITSLTFIEIWAIMAVSAFLLLLIHVYLNPNPFDVGEPVPVSWQLPALLLAICVALPPVVIVYFAIYYNFRGKKIKIVTKGPEP